MVSTYINAGRPVGLWGYLPRLSSGSANHAVLAYGKTTQGHNIVHYGYSGKTNIVLNSGIVGSNMSIIPQ